METAVKVKQEASVPPISSPPFAGDNTPLEDLNIRKLVFSYLIRNCYGNTGRAFLCDLQNIAHQADDALFPGESDPSQSTASPASPMSTTSSATPSLVLKRQVAPMLASSSISSSVVRQKPRNCRKPRHAKAASGSAHEPEDPELDVDGDCDMIDAVLSSSSMAHVNGKSSGCCLGGMAGVTPTGDAKTNENHDYGFDFIKDNNVALSTLRARTEVYQAVLAGNMSLSVSLCNTCFPPLLSSDPESHFTTPQSLKLLFRLECQHFVECVREGRANEALAFAQENLSRYPAIVGSKHAKEYEKTLSDVVALIAYTDPESSVCGHYLSLENKTMLADDLNDAILELQLLPKRSPLEQIVRQTKVVHDMIAEETTSKAKPSSKSQRPPRWEFDSFVEESVLA